LSESPVDNNASVMSSSSGAPVMGVSEIHRLMKHLPVAIAMLFKELHLSWGLDVPRTLDDQATVAESPTGSKVFISYYHEDVQQAERVCAAVQDAGFETWMDKSDLPAGDWDDNLEKNGLRQSRAMIVIASPEAMESKEVHDEWHYAREHRLMLIPFIIRECKLRYRIDRQQHIDATNDFDGGLQDLVKLLRRSSQAW
jgi:hypothetical protein